MKNLKIGFLGGGNMGGALASAVAKSAATPDVLIFDIDKEKADALAKKIGGRAVGIETLAKESDFLFLGNGITHRMKLTKQFSRHNVHILPEIKPNS